MREFLFGLEKADRTAIGTDIKTVEYGWPLGMPVLLHGFIKKTQTAPQQDLKLADKRRKDVERGSFDG